MTISSRVARPLLSGIFIFGGLEAVRNPESKVKKAEKVTKPLAGRIEALPDDAATYVRVNGGIQVAAGVLLALGKFRRLSALVLAGSIIPTTYAGHAFWDELDDEKRAQQKVHLLKNAAVLGGLILAATDTEGAPSASWRIKRRVHRARGGPSKDEVARARKAVHHASKGLSESGAHAWTRVDDAAQKGADVVGKILSSGADLTGSLVSQAQEHLASA
jgi:putative oxidoreductase